MTRGIITTVITERWDQHKMKPVVGKRILVLLLELFMMTMKVINIYWGMIFSSSLISHLRFDASWLDILLDICHHNWHLSPLGGFCFRVTSPSDLSCHHKKELCLKNSIFKVLKLGPFLVSWFPSFSKRYFLSVAKVVHRIGCGSWYANLKRHLLKMYHFIFHFLSSLVKWDVVILVSIILKTLVRLRNF